MTVIRKSDLFVMEVEEREEEVEVICREKGASPVPRIHIEACGRTIPSSSSSSTSILPSTLHTARLTRRELGHRCSSITCIQDIPGTNISQTLEHNLYQRSTSNCGKRLGWEGIIVMVGIMSYLL